jgi:methyl-accepting chemotaxis protein
MLPSFFTGKRVNELKIDSDTIKREHQKRILHHICLLWLGLYACGPITFGILILLTGYLFMVIAFILYSLCILGALFVLSLNRRGLYKQASLLMIAMNFVLLSYIAWLLDAVPPIPVLTSFLITALAMALTDGLVILVVTGLSILLSIGIYFNHDVFHLLTKPDLLPGALVPIIMVVALVIAIPGIVATVYLPTRSYYQLLNQQNRRLYLALNEIEMTQQANHQISQQVLAIVPQLKTTANQQATGSHEQVTSVTQVQTSVSELASTAKSIAELSQEVDQAADGAVVGSNQIGDIITQAVNQSEKGLAAVQNIGQASDSLARFYRQLLDTMEELSSKSKNMRLIVELIGSVATETHLLALNAAIEAAGAGEYGDRFAVVAQEVKNLAGRSAQAVNRINTIIEEVESAYREVRKVAETGYGQTEEMKQEADQTGLIIRQMSTITEQSKHQTSSIDQIARKIKQLTEVVRNVTVQQSSSSQQVLEALTVLSVIAKQSAASSTQVSFTADQLEEVSKQLSTTA